VLLLLAYVGSRFVLEVLLHARHKFVAAGFAVLVLLWLLRAARGACAHRAGRAPMAVAPQDMLSCAHCGVTCRVMKPCGPRWRVLWRRAPRGLREGASACMSAPAAPRANTAVR